jgi:hypothetical protein
MPFPSSPDDRPDPNDNMPAMRARIPDHVARGEVSTGVIVVTGGTEYVLDFVRNLPRPNAVVARVVLPHMVMPQFIEALAANIELFRNRYGELPGAPASSVVSHPFQSGGTSGQSLPPGVEPKSVDVWAGASPTMPSSQSPVDGAGPNGIDSNGGSMAGTGSGAEPTRDSANPSPMSNDLNGNQVGSGSQQLGNGNNQPGNSNVMKRQNPQEVYDDLKLRDEILSGSYANAVMIGHGPYEFSFDFITNFYPQSAVSCRVYLASGHIYRLLESLRASWDQLRPRLSQQFPPPPPPRNQ